MAIFIPVYSYISVNIHLVSVVDVVGCLANSHFPFFLLPYYKKTNFV